MSRSYCVYILKFDGYNGKKISTKNPLIKVGISYNNAETRIKNNTTITNLDRTDDVPWKELFDKVEIIEQVIGLNQTKAKEIEKKILTKWGIKDFTMDEYVSGINEFRIYNLDRENLAKQILWMVPIA
jgi:hypothetical protein